MFNRLVPQVNVIFYANLLLVWNVKWEVLYESCLAHIYWNQQRSSLNIYIYILSCWGLGLVEDCTQKSWQQHPTRHQLYGHLPPITKSIQVRRTRHAGHCWRSRDELIRDVLLWIPTHGRAKAGRPARTYIQQLCEDTGCCPEDLPRAMNDREEWRERVRDIRAASTIWWWWWWWYIVIHRQTCSVGRSCRIHRLHLCRGVRPLPRVS